MRCKACCNRNASSLRSRVSVLHQKTEYNEREYGRLAHLCANVLNFRSNRNAFFGWKISIVFFGLPPIDSCTLFFLLAREPYEWQNEKWQTGNNEIAHTPSSSIESNEQYSGFSHTNDVELQKFVCMLLLFHRTTFYMFVSTWIYCLFIRPDAFILISFWS